MPARISAALDWCDTLILLWSQEAEQSYWVAQEWESAFHLQKRIIPCVLGKATLPALLRSRLYLDFSSYAAGYRQLCRTLGVTPGADQPELQNLTGGSESSALRHGVSPHSAPSATSEQDSVKFPRRFRSWRMKAVFVVLGLAAAITMWRLRLPSDLPVVSSDPSSAEPTAQEPSQASKGSVRLHSLLAGSVFIDSVRVGEIASAQTKEYPLVTGSHVIEVRSASETQKTSFTIAQGQTTEVTLRPSIKTPTVPPPAPREPTPRPPEGMVLIPAGSFMMGSEDGDDDEKPVHEVHVDAFYLDQYEVSVAQYQSYLHATGRSNPENWDEQLQNPNRPVVYVSWEDAMNYAQWAGKRLPTEAEWEYAARGGNTGLAGNPK